MPEERKAFLLRINPKLWRVLEGWAADDLRSVNGQVEYLLQEAAKRAGRLKGDGGERVKDGGSENPSDVPPRGA